MSLEFRGAPDWLLKEYANRKDPLDKANEGLGIINKGMDQRRAAEDKRREIDSEAFAAALESYDPEHPEASMTIFSAMGGKDPRAIASLGDFKGKNVRASEKEALEGRKTQAEIDALKHKIQPEAEDTLDKIAAGLVKSGKITLEQAYKMKASSSPSSNLKPPQGFRYTTDGSLEPIPGGPAAIKIGDKETKEKGLRDAAISNADLVISKVDQALSNVGSFSAGLGSVLSVVPGTPAKNLVRDIDTIKANLGFSALQEMRRNSPTGGALGQVAVQELEMLQSTVASLDSSQSPDQLRRNLGEVKKHYDNWKKAVQDHAASGGAPKSRIEELRAKRDAGTLRY